MKLKNFEKSEQSNPKNTSCISKSIHNNNNNPCYVATLVYESYDAPETKVLRTFRDRVLLQTKSGRAFVRFYYATSPALCVWLKDKLTIRTAIKSLLDSLVSRIKNSNITNT